MPETLRQYTLLEKIGSGRLGDLFKAQDTRIGRTVAIRLVTPAIAGGRDTRARLLEDARKAEALSHPNVAGLVEWGEEDGRLFLVFEHVVGDRLSAVVGGRPLNVRRAIDFGIQIADALAEAHALGLIHGDLRPDTIVITPKGRPKLLDFGFLAWTNGGRIRQAVADLAAVDRQVVSSTVAYMSPEQALGEQYDHRTDIFSLGVLLFEMLTGRSPFSAETGTAALVGILHAQPPPASTINPLVPPALDQVVSRALAKSLGSRYQNAALLATALRQVGAEIDQRSEAAAAEAVPAGVPRAGRRSGCLLVLLFLSALLALGAWFGGVTPQKLADRRLRRTRAPVVAALPFEAGGGGQTYFSTGFTEDLLARLAQIDGMTVLGRRSVRDYRTASPGEVGRETGAAFVLTGSVQQDRGQVQALVRLVDPARSREVWTDRFDGDDRHVVALEAEIAGRIAHALGLTVPPSAARSRVALRAVQPAGYDLYLQGREAMAEDDLSRAVPLFEQAVALDPTLAEGQAALAVALAAVRESSGEWTLSLATRITAAAGAAVAADPDLPAAQLAMAVSEAGEAAALDYLRRAVELDPGFATGYHRIADEIAAIDPARATAFYKRALDLDPRFDETYRDRAQACSLLGRFEDALGDLTRGRALHPGRWWWQAMLARVQFDQGRFHEGLQIAAEGAVMTRSASCLLAYAGALHSDGRTREALEAVTEFQVRRPGACTVSAMRAALEFDLGRRREATASARRIFDATAGPGPVDFLYPCAAMAAAAIRDVEGASTWLRAVTASEPAVRRWFREGQGHSPDAAFRRGAYPWTTVAAHPLVKAAGGDLERARVRLRAEVARTVDGLLDKEHGRPASPPKAGDRRRAGPTGGRLS